MADYSYRTTIPSSSSFGYFNVQGVFNTKVGYQGMSIKNHLLELYLEANIMGLVYSGGSTGTVQTNSYLIGANYWF